MDLIPGLEKSPGVGNGNPLQHSCLENSTDKGDWQVTVHGVAESDTTKHAHTCMHREEQDSPGSILSSVFQLVAKAQAHLSSCNF